MAAAASTSKFRDPEVVESMLEDEEFNIVMYFVHGEFLPSETAVPPNSILIQTGEGASFGCTLDTSADPEIVHWFLEDREKAFRMLMGAETMQIGVLSFFQLKVEKDPIRFDKMISLTVKDLEKGLPRGQKWGIYLVDQITNKLFHHVELTEYVIKKTDKYGGVTQTKMMERTNKVLNDKPNIHIFVNCSIIPKTFPAALLAELEIPTGGPVATRSVTRHVEPNKNSYTRKNLTKSRDFEALAIQKVASEIRKKLKAAYGFELAVLREFRKTINEKAAQLVRVSLEGNNTSLKTYLGGSERKAVAEFVAGLQTQISMIVFDTSAWTGGVGGGSAERRRRTRRGRGRL